MTGAVLAAAALLAAGSVRGTVRAEPSGEPIPYAVVELPALARRAVADAHGWFVLAGVPAGEQRARAAAPGYAPWAGSVTVPRDGVAALEVRMPVQPVELGGVRALASAASRDVAGPAGEVLAADAIRAIPAVAEPDVLRAVQSLPSVAATSDFSSAPYVRGGSPDETLLTLDGAPLFNPYHLAGLFAAFDPDAVSTVEVSPGALPAAEGDRLSGMVEVVTREGSRDRHRTSGAWSVLSARAAVEGPLPRGRGTYLVSARRSYLDVVTAALSRLGVADPFPYAFTDLHLRATAPAGAAGRLSAAVYANREGFALPDRWKVGEGRWRWGANAASLQYRAPLGRRTVLTALGAVSTFSGRLDGGAEGSAPPEIARSSMRDLLASLRVVRHGAAHRVTAGMQVDAYRLRHRVDDAGPGALHDFLPPLQVADAPRTVAAWVGDEWQASARLRVAGGIRMLAPAGGPPVWMPRAGARLSLSPRLSLSAGAGRYTQMVQTLRDEEASAAGLFAYDLLVGADPHHPPTATDAAVGVEWDAGATRVRIDGYAKRYRNLALAPLAADPATAPALVAEDRVSGRGSAEGVEVMLLHEGGPHRLMVSYALGRTRREMGDQRFAARFGRRHVLDVSESVRWGAAGELLARLAAGSGQPFTPPGSALVVYRYDPATGTMVPAGTRVVYGPHNSSRLPAYARLDVGVRRTLNRRWLGRRGTVTPYAQVLNVLATRNVLFATPRDDGTPHIRYAPQLPTLPAFGFEWRF